MSTLAMIFPGQAAQKVGMLSTLAEHYPLVEETFSEVSGVLGYDIWKLVQSGPATELNKTYRAQPAILTASVAVWRIWKQKGGCIPKIMAGHSLGEYSALVCSGSMDLCSAAKLVMIRGMLMQEVIPDGIGAMSAIIGLSDDIVCELCKAAQQDQIVSPASFNAPGHVVISGHKEAVNRVNLCCKNAGAKHAFMLPISVPSHCSLMKPVVERFREELEKVTVITPRIPVINNVDVCIEWEPNDIRSALIRQLYTPVRWNAIVQYCVHRKIKRFVEMGPGKILTRLIHSTISDAFSLSVNDPISLLDAIRINEN
ncbi:ACP S-malonyltransferase [Blochmannia endosymbiont of Camponotus sp. C-003]|uniref:ACP S-malonyltransferase n=1 Tax=unclassified Candidatus Blochmanniella TaxID=711328 RepID=UPI0020244941|nr:MULTISPECIES: ACP S-malonyltransferase [unclassified Candidatus Blochmannia]URJ23415.1 ACP S-malonyltransferase [Blochmannia endosymbiont of Camponotus sp. C-003]URJ29072.1 ACP S-malonyltransferase [Blochmannia endosymbiont of Camponotus sp. C-046]